MWECAERCGRQREIVSALAFSTLDKREALRSARTHQHNPVAVSLQFFFGQTIHVAESKY